MSDNAPQKDSAAPNADQPPPPHNIAGETVGEAVVVPTPSRPPPRRNAAAAAPLNVGAKHKDKRNASKKRDSKPSDPRKQPPPSRDASKVRKHRDDSTKHRSGRDSTPAAPKGPSGPQKPSGKQSAAATTDKIKPASKDSAESASTKSLPKGPSGPKTPPGKPSDANPSTTTTPHKGSAEPPRSVVLPGYRIPKVLDTRPKRTEKEEAAARAREKGLSSKNYAKDTLLPHYEQGNHPLNSEKSQDWDDTRHPSEKTPPKRGGLVSSYVALGRNAAQYQLKGPAGTATDKPSDAHPSHKRGHTSPTTESENNEMSRSAQEERERQLRSARSHRHHSHSSSEHSSEHRSRANSGHRPSGLLQPTHQGQSRSRSALRQPYDQARVQSTVGNTPPYWGTQHTTTLQASSEANSGMTTRTVTTPPIAIGQTSAEVPGETRSRSSASKTSVTSRTSAKKSRPLAKHAPDFQHPLGQIQFRAPSETSVSRGPVTAVRSLRVPRSCSYTPIVDTNLRKDRILQMRVDLKKAGKTCPVNWSWFNKLRRDRCGYELEFTITHFVHPASVVPAGILPVKTGIIPPSIQACAAENELLPNEFIRGIILGCHPSIAFLIDDTVLGLLKGHLASTGIPGYAPVGIFTGLDFTPVSSETYPKWRDDGHIMFSEQTRAFEGFVQIALDFMTSGIRRPLCLTLRSKKGGIYHAIEDAMEILRMRHVPSTFPIYLTNWSGTPNQAWKWLRTYPNTIFGITFDFVVTRSDCHNEDFLHELPLANMVLESGSPKRRCADQKYATPLTCMETACALQELTGEDHHHILQETSWTALQFFFPDASRPPQWARNPSTQGNDGVTMKRCQSVNEKILELDMIAANAAQPASADARPAGGLPSMSAEQLKKKISQEQFDKRNKPIMDSMEIDEPSVFDVLMKDFSPNAESFQEMDIRRERADSGGDHLVSTSEATTTGQGSQRPSGLNQRRETSPPPLDYETEAAAAAAEEQAVTERAKELASRIIFPKGKTTAEKRADAARTAGNLRKAETKGFPSRPDDVVLDFPEFDDDFWDIEVVARPFPILGPANPSRWSIIIPGPKRTYYEPLEDCHDHDAQNDPHLKINEAVPGYRTICKERGNKYGPEKAVAIGHLHIESYGKMYAILWAARHHMKPKRNPEDPSEIKRGNTVVLSFMNDVARSRSSELPRLMNRYFDDIREGFTDEPFVPYDFQTAIMRWNDCCPNASAFFNEHATGPIYYQPTFLGECRDNIREAYLRVAQTFFRDAMDWCRMRRYQVVAGFQRPWTPVRQINWTTKDKLVKVHVDTNYILQDEQIMFVDSWGMQFTNNLRPNVKVVVLSDLNTEAIEEARKYFMGHLVRKIYWFHGAAAFQLRTDGYGRTGSNLAQHFSRMFPHVRFHYIIAPFTYGQRRAWHNHVHSSFSRYREHFPDVTVIMHPTDADLCEYFDECERSHLDSPPWPSTEQNQEGQLSTEGLRRRKEYMEVHYEVDLWLQREHDTEIEKEEQAAAQELVDELEELEEQTRLPVNDSAPVGGDPMDEDVHSLEEPAGSNFTAEECTSTGEPAGSRAPVEEPQVQSWTATVHVKETASDQLEAYFSKVFSEATPRKPGRKPHRYDYLPKPTEKKVAPSLADFMKRAAMDAHARKIKSAEAQSNPEQAESSANPSDSEPVESSAPPSNQEHRQAEEYPSRPSTTDTVSDLSDASLPFKLPSITPSGAEYASALLSTFRERFNQSVQQGAFDSLVAGLAQDTSGDFLSRVLRQLEGAQLLGPAGPLQEPHHIPSGALNEQLQITKGIGTDESQPSMLAPGSQHASADATTSDVVTYEPLAESTVEDDGSLIETDNEDPYRGPSHGLDWS